LGDARAHEDDGESEDSRANASAEAVQIRFDAIHNVVKVFILQTNKWGASASAYDYSAKVISNLTEAVDNLVPCRKVSDKDKTPRQRRGVFVR
jgi:hypothetical protein